MSEPFQSPRVMSLTSFMKQRLSLPLGLAITVVSLVQMHAAPAARFNTLGYLPDAPKRASVVGVAGEFAVLRAIDGQVVLTRPLSEPIHNQDTDEPVRQADFSALKSPGEYKLRFSNGEVSAPFAIAADLYRQPLTLVTRAMYLWRCGTEVEGEWQGARFHQRACHLDDAWLDHVTGQHEKLPSVGGWHDAGDYNKYVVNAGVTVGVMLRAWEDFPVLRELRLTLPESGGPLPDYLAEIKYETEWLLTMQADDGRVYTKVSTERFGGFISADKEDTPRYVAPWGTPATADFVAMLAQAARAFQPYAPDYAKRCLDAALHSYRFLLAHPEHHEPDQSKFRTGGYKTKDADDRLWAAAEIWETTGDPAALEDLETRIRDLAPQFDENWDWAEVKNLGLFTYLYSRREGRSSELVATVRRSLVATADTLVAKAAAHGYARPLDARYYWGCNGGVARQTLVLLGAYRLERKPAYRWAALDAVNHLFGRNVDGRSYVTGLGTNPPQAPHDRRSGGDEVAPPWPGYLVGGPHPTARDWKDVQTDARTNEIAINWNAALIYALAGLVE